MLSQQEMSDRFEIEDLLKAYCHAIDRRDWDKLHDIFTDNAVIDYTQAGGEKGNLEFIKPWLDKALKNFSSFQHMISTTELAINGDDATARSILFNPMVIDENGTARVMFVGMWYVDKLIRTEAGWRISERREEASYFHNFPRDFTPSA